MSNAAGDGGGGGAGAAVELEFENIDDAVSKMKKISDTISTLEGSFSKFAAAVKPSDWSEEPSCVQFGTSYKAAVSVYSQVIAGMKSDLSRYAAALESASKDYKTSDANSAAALAKLGAVDDSGLSQDSSGQRTYHDDKHHGELSSDKPQQATDTTPDNKSGDTKMPGAHGDNSGTNGAQDNGGAGQSTQPNQGRDSGTSQGGPNGGSGGAGQTTPPSGSSQGGTTR